MQGGIAPQPFEPTEGDRPAHSLGGDGDIVEPGQQGDQLGDLVAPGMVEQMPDSRTPEERQAEQQAEADAAAKKKEADDAAAAKAAEEAAKSAPKFKFGNAEVEQSVAQQRLDEYARLSPLVEQVRTANYLDSNGKPFGLDGVLHQGLTFLAQDQAFGQSPEAAMEIVGNIVAAAREIHGDKFTIPEDIAASIDPNNLDDAGKIMYGQLNAANSRVKNLEATVLQLTQKVTEMNGMLSQRADAKGDLAKLHAALPETVGRIDDAALAKMKAETGVTDPVAAYKLATWTPDGSHAGTQSQGTSAGGTTAAGGAQAQPVGVPDAPRPGSSSLPLVDPDDQNVTADQIVRAAQQGRLKGGVPERFRTSE